MSTSHNGQLKGTNLQKETSHEMNS
uniref:Uncharacterized protein MANES_13G042800 n=1 Tax=Rhizophora mucronata TaxID=61149 RepID=A0A2P2MUI7_RHIMU